MAPAVFPEVFLCLWSWKADEPHCLGVSRQRSSLKSDFQYRPRNQHRILKTLGGIKRNQEITEEHPVAPFWAPLTSYSRDPPSLHLPVCFPLHIGATQWEICTSKPHGWTGRRGRAIRGTHTHSTLALPLQTASRQFHTAFPGTACHPWTCSLQGQA